jgi:tRNA nucleotidyltransferase (CCA-adding enzyme)
MGPPVDLKSHQLKFREKWKNNPLVIHGPYIKNKRWYIDIRKEYTDLTSFIQTILPKLSLGKDLDSIIKNHFTMMKTNDLIKEDFSIFWTQHLDLKETWER